MGDGWMMDEWIDSGWLVGWMNGWMGETIHL